jgi:transglutaminase-like putative cysteine protease
MLSLSAQNKFKFGDCPRELLEMTSYDKDSEAQAVVLYENADAYYQINAVSADFEIVTEYVVRIKIFTQDGIDHFAEMSIPFYKGRTSALSENVKGLTGWTYNLEGDKVVKTKLSKEYIFTEDITENNKRIKFALPAVKTGSVIEYKYIKTSPYYYYPEDFVFQRTIPVQYALFTIKIPEYLSFNKEMKGYESINVITKPINQTYMYRSQSLSCSAQEISAEVKDLPALKDEDYVWNYNDFKSRINFEIRSVQIPGAFYKDYAQTWNKIVESLKDYDWFGKQFNNKGLFKEELPTILDGKTNETDSIRAILNLVRSKIKWNDQSTLRIENQSKALKGGAGSSAEINALLLNALRNAGFTAHPVVMSLRSRGRIPITYPSIDNLNYFIVGVYSGQNTYYLDATRSFTDINVIPVDCMVDKALAIYRNNFDWIDLTTIGNNMNRVNLLLNFNEEGILEGKKSEIHSGEVAYSFKQSYDNAENEEKYVESMETRNDIVISNYKMEEKTTSNFTLSETYGFLKDNIRLGDEVISFNPLLFLAMKNNAFKAETRKLPIEFSFPYEQRINVSFTIPEGYTVDEIPASERFIYKDDGLIDFSYVIQQGGSNVQLSYKLKLNTCIIPATDYENLRDFWSKMYNKENEWITIKKL